MAIGIIVGKEISQFANKDTGELVMLRKLYLLWDKPRRPADGFEGRKVQVETCSFDISDLAVGDRCNFEYEINVTSKGKTAKLVDVEPLGHIDLDAVLAPEGKK